MDKKRIVIASDGTKTHVFIDGSVYGDRITEFEFLSRGLDGKDPNRKVGESGTYVRVKADTLPINGDSSEEKIEEFKNFISYLMGDTPSDGESMKNKKKRLQRQKPKKPSSLNVTLCGETILRQIQALEREYRKRNGRLIDG